ncbi:MAG TPA: hypothetical protein PLJ98_02125, partial [Acholeplasmataceae bacterium]|nr:hypothetical protein [Acholeplasmataceae bacterium]
PHISLILSAVFASILVAAEFLISSISVESLLTFVVFAGLIFNTLIFISLFKFRKTHPVEQYPRYQVWGYPVVPGLAILGLVMLLVATLLESLVPSLIGLGVLILGYMIFTWIELRKKKLA